MGNCCKKKDTSERGKSIRSKPDGTTLTQNLVEGAEGADNVVTVPEPKVDQVSIDLIKSLNMEPLLDTVKDRITAFGNGTLKKISDDKDPFELFFDVTSDDKDKIHTTLMKSKSNMSPLQYKLVNSLIPEADELKISTNYERFETVFRGKIGNVYYIINYALYKQIMLFSKKDLFIVKAFKEYENGDVVEVTLSAQHPDYMETKGIDRMGIIENICLYTKTPEGCDIISLNRLYPRVGAGFTILKPLFSKGFRTYNKLLGEYLVTVTKTVPELEEEFKHFFRAEDV